MTLKTLAQRYQEVKNNIYNQPAYSANGPDRPFLVISPLTTPTVIRTDTRSVPTTSTSRDVERITKFLASSTGQLFLNTQEQLQKANTFTRNNQFDRNSILANVQPFTHAQRFLESKKNTAILLGGTSGLLQLNTVDTIAARISALDAVSKAASGITSVLSGERSIASLGGSIGRSLARGAIVGVGSLVYNKIQNKQYIPQTLGSTRPENKVFGYSGLTAGVGSIVGGILGAQGPVLFDQQPLGERGSVRLGLQTSTKNILQNAARTAATTVAKRALTASIMPKPVKALANAFIPDTPKSNTADTFVQAVEKFRANFNNKRLGKRGKSKFLEETDSLPVDNKVGTLSDIPQAVSTKTVLSDPFNVINTQEKYENPYSILVAPPNDTNTDIINFSFKSARQGAKPIRFRAFLSNIREAVKPEFNEQKYIGRIERFVTYSGVKRSVNMQFNIVAFSSSDHEAMWTRINYLTSLAFPQEISTSGFFTPPLFYISIGGLYDVQPGYIETLDYEFLDDSTTFDVDTQVPFAIKVTMQINLLEKQSKFYDSPFYAITEGTFTTNAAAVEPDGNVQSQIIV